MGNESRIIWGSTPNVQQNHNKRFTWPWPSNTNKDSGCHRAYAAPIPLPFEWAGYGANRQEKSGDEYEQQQVEYAIWPLGGGQLAQRHWPNYGATLLMQSVSYMSWHHRCNDHHTTTAIMYILVSHTLYYLGFPPTLKGKNIIVTHGTNMAARDTYMRANGGSDYSLKWLCLYAFAP